jgi:hypothetical protein
MVDDYRNDPVSKAYRQRGVPQLQEVRQHDAETVAPRTRRHGRACCPTAVVMAGFVLAIHAFCGTQEQGVDARDERGHDG